MADLSQDRVVSNNQKLYNNLLKSGKVTQDELGDFNTFNTLLSDSSNASKLRDNLISKKNFSETELGSHDDFLQNLDPPQQQPEPTATERETSFIPEVTANGKALVGSIPATRPDLSINHPEYFAPKISDSYKTDNPVMNPTVMPQGTGNQFQAIDQTQLENEVGGAQIVQDKPLDMIDRLKVDYARKRGEQYAVQKENEIRNGTGSFGGEVVDQLQSGGESLLAATYGTPGYLYDFLGAGFRGLGMDVPLWKESLAKEQKIGNTDVNPLSFLEKQKNELLKMAIANDIEVRKANPNIDKGVYELFAKGDSESIQAGFRNIFSSIAQSAPASIAMMATGGMSIPSQIGLGAAVFGSQNMNEADKTGDYGGVSRDALLAINAVTGSFESAFETTLGSGAVGRGILNLIKSQGKDAAEKQIKEGITSSFSKMIIENPWLAPFGESFEEMGTQLSQNIVNKYTGYKPDIKITDGVVDSGIIGLVMGTGFSGVIGGAKKAMAERNAQPITTATIEGQQFTVNNPEDLGIERKPIFAKDAEGKIIPLSGKKKDGITDVVTTTQGELDQAQQAAADQQALMSGIADPNAQVVDELDSEGARVIDFSNGQTKIIYNGQEVIANNIDEKDRILNSITDYEKLPEPINPKVPMPETGENESLTPGEESKVSEVPAKPKYPLDKDGNPDIDQMDDQQRFDFNTEYFGQESAIESVKKSIRIKGEKIDKLKAKLDKLEDAAETKAMFEIKKLEKIKAKQEQFLSEVSINENNSETQTENVADIQTLNADNQLQIVNNESENEQINQLQNEELKNTSPKVDGEPAIVKGENTPQAQQGERNEEGLEENVNQNIISTDQPAVISLAADPVAEQIAQQEVNLNPTEAQKEAGNYKMAHIVVQGMPITIENPKGSIRRGKDQDGKTWENELQSHYGYFKKTNGKDGDHIDTFIGSNPESEMIFVVDQNNPKTGAFDESKVMTGYNSIEEAKAAYLANYESGWKGLSAITAVPVDKFKTWLNDGAKQTKPYSEYKDTPVANQPKPVKKPNTIIGKAKEIEVAENDIQGLALQYFVNGGLIAPDEILRMFRNNKNERNFRNSYTSNEEGQTVAKIAHGIWESLPETIQDGLGEMDVYNAVESVIMSHNNPTSMAQSLLKKYILDPNQGYSEEWLNHQLKLEEQERLSELALIDEYYQELENNGQLPTENELIELFLPENTDNGKQEINQRRSIEPDRPVNPEGNDQIGENIQGSEPGVQGENESEVGKGEVVVPKAEVKEPWQMSFAEFDDIRPSVDGYLYHGSPEGDIKQIDPYTHTKNWGEGLGFYTTESRDIADSYAKGRTATKDRKKGNGKINYIRQSDATTLDMDLPVDVNVWDQIKDRFELDYTENPNTNGEAYRELILSYNENNFTSEGQYIIEEALTGLGYAATIHTEGKKNGNPHRVTIWKDEFALPEVVVPKDVHKQQIQKALSEGKQVPQEVLNDYPELKQPKLPLSDVLEAGNKEVQEKKAISVVTSLLDGKFEVTHKEMNAANEALQKEGLSEFQFLGEKEVEKEHISDVVADINLRNTPIEKLIRRVATLDNQVEKALGVVTDRMRIGRDRGRTAGALNRDVDRLGGNKDVIVFARKRLQNEIDRRKKQSTPLPEEKQSDKKPLDEVLKEGKDEVRFRIAVNQAKDLPYKTILPASQTFIQAVENTPDAKITEDGLIIKVVRFQTPDQESELSVRTGVFYLPSSDPNIKHYKTGKNGYGGTVKQEGETLIKKPIFVKGATGGKAPENAYDQIKGKGAYQAMRTDVLRATTGYNKRVYADDVYNILDQYGAEPDLAWHIVDHSKGGNTLPYAVQENIVAHTVREAGYDAVIGYSTKKDGSPFISEIFDVREITYPSNEIESDIHDLFLEEVRFRIIGETGAGNLDKATEATTRLDNLKVAREMEQAGKDAKTISLSTGWERGADSKWRYEVPDDIEFKKDVAEELRNNQKLANNTHTFSNLNYRKNADGTYDLGMMKKGATSTSEFASYRNVPDKELEFIFDNNTELVSRIRNNEGGEGYIGENLDEAKELNIEFEHYVDGGQSLSRVIIGKDLFQSYPDLKNIIVVYDPKSESQGSFYQTSGGQKVISLRTINGLSTKSTLIHEIQHAIQDIEGFTKGGNEKTALSLSDNLTENALKDISLKTVKKIANRKGYNLNETQLGKIAEQVALWDNADDNEVKKLSDELGLSENEIAEFFTKDAHEIYRRLAGEVESRNVQTRMNFTPEQRRNTLLQETEDVSREDQIILMDGLGVSNLELNITDTASTDLSNRPNVVKALTKISDELGEPVHIINSSEIPAQVGELKKQITSGNRVPAFFYNGKIYLLSDQVTSVSDAIKSYLHELIVHKGLREVFAGAEPTSIIGKQYAKFNDLMVDVFGSMSRSQKIETAAKYVPGLYNQNGKIMYTPTAAEKALIGEEFLAHVSENPDIYDAPTLSKWQQFINRLSQIIRKAFRLTSNQFSQSDLLDIVRESRARLKNKAEGKTEDVSRFRVTEENLSLGENTPMTEKEFYKKYEYQHKDIRSNGKEKALETLKQVQKTGFNSGAYVISIYKGGNPSNIIQSKYGPRKGDMIYLVPKEWIKTHKINPTTIKEGWKPTDNELVEIEYDNQSAYEAYVNHINKNKSDVSLGDKPNDMDQIKELNDIGIVLKNSASTTNSQYFEYTSKDVGVISVRISDHASNPKRGFADIDTSIGNSTDKILRSVVKAIVKKTMNRNYDFPNTELLHRSKDAVDDYEILKSKIVKIKTGTRFDAVLNGNEKSFHTYKDALSWSKNAESIKPIDEYNTDLPIDAISEFVDKHFKKQESQPSNTILINGAPRPTLNSNSKPIAETEEGIRNFYKWFGDSKVVDAEDRPTIVFHGTNKDFDIFKSTKFSTAGYFAIDPSFASNFAEIAAPYSGNSPSVIPVYLNISNPADFTFIKDGYADLLPNEMILSLPFSANDELKSKIFSVYKGTPQPLFSYLSEDFIIDSLKDNGFNGISFNEVSPEHFNTFSENKISNGKAFVAFFPNQIKSATGNNGSFDPQSNDIRFQIVKDEALSQLKEDLDKITTLQKSTARLNELEDSKAGKTKVEKQTIINQISKYKEGYRAGASEKRLTLYVIQRNIIKYASDNMNYDQATKGEINQLLTAIKNANTPATISKAFDRIDEIVTKMSSNQEREGLKKDIEALIRQATSPKRTGTMTMGKFNIEDVRQFAIMKKYNDEAIRISTILRSNVASVSDKNAAGKELDRIWDELNEIADKTIIDEVTLKIIDWRRSGSRVSVQLLTAIKDDLELLYKQAKDAKTEEDIKIAIVRKNDREFISKFIRDKKYDMSGLAKRFNISLNNFTANVMGNWETVMTMLGGVKLREKTSLIMPQVHQEMGVHNTFNEVLKKAYKAYGFKSKQELLLHIQDLSKKDFELIQPNFRGGKVEGAPDKISMMQIMDIYNAIKNRNIQTDWYLSYGDVVLDSSGKADIDIQMSTGRARIEKLISNLSEGDKKFADIMMDKLQEYSPQTNEVFVKLFNMDRKSIEVYWPSSALLETDVDVMEQFFEEGKIPSFFKDRAAHRTPVAKDAFGKFTQHVKESEWIVNMALPLNELNKTFRNSSVKKLIEQNRGNKFYGTIKRHLQDVGLRPTTKELTDFERVGGSILSNWVVAKIGLSISVPLKQLIGAVNYAENMPAEQWLLGFAKGLADPKGTFDEVWENCPYLQVRFNNGYSEALQYVMNATSNLPKASNWHQAIKNIGTIGTRGGDIATLIYGGKPYIDYLIKNGMSKKDAYDKFIIETLRAQQSGLTSTLSIYQRSNNPFARALFTFGNTPSQYMRKMFEANQAFRHGDINAKQVAKVYSIYAVANSILYVGAGMLISAMLTGDDPEDEWEKMVIQGILSFVGGLPLINDLAESASRQALGLKVYDDALPVLVELNDIRSRLIKVMQSDVETEKKKVFLKDAIISIFELGGISAGNAERMYDATINRDNKTKELKAKHAREIISKADKYLKFVRESAKREDNELHSKLMSDKAALGAVSRLVISDSETGYVSYDTRIMRLRKYIKYWKNIKTPEAEKKVDEYELYLENTYNEILEKYSDIEFPDSYKLNK